jgi:hypothetical protein
MAEEQGGLHFLLERESDIGPIIRWSCAINYFVLLFAVVVLHGSYRKHVARTEANFPIVSRKSNSRTSYMIMHLPILRTVMDLKISLLLQPKVQPSFNWGHLQNPRATARSLRQGLQWRRDWALLQSGCRSEIWVHLLRTVQGLSLVSTVMNFRVHKEVTFLNQLNNYSYKPINKGSSSCRQEDNTKPDLKKWVWNVEWIHLAEDNVQWLTHMNTIINAMVP